MRMTERLKKLWDRLPKLPRRWRIVRNLAVTAAAAALIPALLDWPCLSAYGAFHRLEGAYLLTPSRLVYQVEGGWGSGFLSEGDSWITVGSVAWFDDGGKPLNLDRNYALLHQVLPKEGIVAVFLPAKTEDNGAVVAVWGGPAEAVSGTLELDLMGIEDPFGNDRLPGRVPVQGLETFTAQAGRREDGWFIFQFVPHSNHRENQSCAMEMLLWSGAVFRGAELEQPYRLTLADSQGNQVAEQSGTLPPDQRLQIWR
ncbi:MAG: hypothetical protein HFF44_05925 [Lawsonibacter sp.]|nr:hypothetical protein [Lawsonibacter sp.]